MYIVYKNSFDYPAGHELPAGDYYFEFENSGGQIPVASFADLETAENFIAYFPDVDGTGAWTFYGETFIYSGGSYKTKTEKYYHANIVWIESEEDGGTVWDWKTDID